MAPERGETHGEGDGAVSPTVSQALVAKLRTLKKGSSTEGRAAAPEDRQTQQQPQVKVRSVSGAAKRAALPSPAPSSDASFSRQGSGSAAEKWKREADSEEDDGPPMPGFGIVFPRLKSAVTFQEDESREPPAVSILAPPSSSGSSMPSSGKNRRIAVRKVVDASNTVAKASGLSATDIKRSTWNKLFDRFQRDKQIHKDNLPNILERLVLCVNSEWIDDCFRQITKPWYTELDQAEFESFMEQYDDRLQVEYQDAFTRYSIDTAQQPMVSTASLSSILAYLGVTATDSVVQETAKEVDPAGMVQLQFEQFEKFLGILGNQQGFGKREYSRIVHAFTHFDVDGSGDLDLDEILNVLMYLNYPVKSDEVAQIVRIIGVEEGGPLSRSDFLLLMRRVREHEVERIVEVLRTHGGRTVGTLQQILHALNFIVDPDVVLEVANQSILAISSRSSRRSLSARSSRSSTKASRSSSRQLSKAETAEHSEEDTFTICEVWQLVEAFRAREGFSRFEVEEMEVIFSRYTQSSGEAEITTLDAGRALQWLGYDTPYEVLQQLAGEVDVDCSGKISFPEFKKLVRKHREREFGLLRQKMDEAGLSQSMQTMKSMREWKAAAMAMDFQEKESATSTGRQKRGERRNAELDGKIRRRSINAALGGGNAEMHHNLREKFTRLDGDRDGLLDAAQFRDLCFSTWDDNHDPKHRDELTRMVDNYVGGTDRFGINDAKQIMSQFYDWKLKMQLVKEQAVVSAGSFTLSQVSGFREVFNEADVNGDGRLSFHTLGRLLAKVCPVSNAKLTRQLAEIWIQVVSPMQQREGCDFPDFLRVVRHLLEVDFGDIKERTAHFGLS